MYLILWIVCISVVIQYLGQLYISHVIIPSHDIQGSCCNVNYI